MRIQIGGSLAKVVYFTRDPDSSSGGGRLNFTKFETEAIEDCIAFLKRLVGDREDDGPKRKMCVMATGGGSYKFYERMRRELAVEVVQEDEMECLIVGNASLPPHSPTHPCCRYSGLLVNS